jgi:hypothetical protein
MRKFVAIFCLSLGALCAQEGKVTVDEKDLTPEQLAKAKAKQTMQTTGEYVKWGHEIGVAVNETLTTLTDNTAKFAKTDVGKWAMFLVTWKIMAKDILMAGNKVIGYLVGIPFFAIGLLVCLWSYRRTCIPHRVITEKGPGLWIWRSKKYEIYDPSTQRGTLGQEGWVAVHALAAAVIAIVGLFIIFT